MEVCRRRYRRLIGFLVLCFAACPALAQTTQPAVRAVVRVGMTVDDMGRSVNFFTDVLDFRRASESQDEAHHARVVDLKLGDETLELVDYLDPGGRAIPSDSHSNDRWFQHIAIVTTDMDAAYKRLLEHHVKPASVSPQRLPDWNKNAGGIRAFYFHDPDDHVLEVINFPEGKGDPRWQKRHELFAGIDHTAIVVADTDASLKFYRDLLGLRIAGESENYGIEQERLNNVPGAHLRITSLRAASGPGIEFLQYLNPHNGRPYPGDAKPQDLVYWITTVATPSVMDVKTLRDPDDHVLRLIPASVTGAEAAASNSR
jgi:catechol 2,3-dioxygenase-like lactoylglutathione lyase family enzyme